MEDPAGKSKQKSLLRLPAGNNATFCPEKISNRCKMEEQRRGEDFWSRRLMKKMHALSIFFFLPVVLAMGVLHSVIQFRKKRIY
ncbi:MAG: hypothetical protein QHH14_14710, partial [Clostridiales bacterium]|nr:hypothetical protein [Clostridiales bacterium]